MFAFKTLFMKSFQTTKLINIDIKHFIETHMYTTYAKSCTMRSFQMLLE